MTNSTDQKNTQAKSKKRFRWLQYALHAAVLGGLAVAGMKYINGAEFARAMAKFNWWYAPVICFLSIAYILVKAERFIRMMKTLTDKASSGTLVRVYLAGQAATLIPGGTAARAGMLEQVGIPVAETAAPLAVAAWSDQAAFLLCTLVAALWVPSVRQPVAILLGVLAVISILLGVEAIRTWLGQIVEKLLGRFKLLEHWREFVASLKTVATPRLLALGLLNALAADVLLVLALHLALRGVGANDVPITTLVLAFALPTMLGRISALPGGVGVTEAGMIPLLDQAAGVTADQAAAAVTVFRLGSVVFAAMVGGAVYLLGWRGERERIHSGGESTEKPTPTGARQEAKTA